MGVTVENPTLIIGNRNYSSWSLRAWLALEATGQVFDEVMVPLGQPDTEEAILHWSPTGKVPAYRDGDIIVWDSLAICEYLAERYPAANLWPEEPHARTAARSVVAEMHSGFVPLRKHMPMNLRASYPGEEWDNAVVSDIERMIFVWESCREMFGEGGDMLFGAFSIADAFFAPIVSRFLTYGVAPTGVAGEYMEAIWSLPAMQQWSEAARAEPWSHPIYDR